MKFSSIALLSACVAAPHATAFVPSSIRSAALARRSAAAPAFMRRRISALSMSTEVPVDVVATAEAPAGETYEFQAEVSRVMDIIINSLYSDKDVFLRELASNAADACDKRRFLSLTDDSASGAPEIKVKADKEAGTLTIEDSGVGMTKDELINNLGKIAQSGTKKFAEALGASAKGETNLIGQFGVGFYSSYLVADKVTVVTRAVGPDAVQYRWESEAGSSYTVAEDTTSEPIEGSGTRLILKLKEDSLEYLEAGKLTDLLQRYSSFIEFPISVFKSTTEYVQVPDEDAEVVEGEEPKTKTVPETKTSYVPIKSAKPLWLRPPRDCEDGDYSEFYKSTFKAFDEPVARSHFSIEGTVEAKALLFIPTTLPFDLSRDMFDENAKNMKLYVKRVFINDSFEGLIPRWLKFVRGVVDSDDLPLNVGREILQQTRALTIINKRLVKKSMDMVRDIEADEDKSKYVMFWNNFGKYLKVGIVEDDRAKDDIAPLCRWFSETSGDEYISFDDYVGAMPEQQKKIYYVTGSTKQQCRMSPALEKLKKKGFDVLLMIDPLDEVVVQNLEKYKDYDLVDVAKEGLDLDEGDDDKKAAMEAKNEEYAELLDFFKVGLGDRIERAVCTDLLTESPAALVQGAYGLSPTMQRYMKAQSVAMGESEMPGMNQAVLEVDVDHPIVRKIDEMRRGGEVGAATEFAELMFDVAALAGGYDIPDAGDFAQRVLSMMTKEAGGGVQDVVMAEPAVEESEDPVDIEKLIGAVTGQGTSSFTVEEDSAPSAEVEVIKTSSSYLDSL